MGLTELFDMIGRKRISAALGVTQHTILIHERNGVAPAPWFDIIEKMAGRPVDRALFRFAAISAAKGRTPGQGIDWRRVIELASAGLGYKAIADETGVSRHKVTTICELSGVYPQSMSALSPDERRAAAQAAMKRWEERVK